MSYMTISGIIMPIKHDGASEGRDDLKTELRAIDGTYVRDVRANKRRWTLMTRHLPLDEARALRNLVMGVGNHWGFQDGSRYSDKGLGSWVGVYTVPTTGGKFGGHLDVTGSGRTLTLGAAYVAAWTVAQWVFDPDEGDWVHRIQTSTGVKIQNGVVVSPLWDQALASGVYTVPYDGTSGFGGCDDLVILPYVMPTSWCLQWPLTVPFSPLPRLSLEGEIIEEASLLVEGRGDPDMPITQGIHNGVWQRLATLSFELVEV